MMEAYQFPGLTDGKCLQSSVSCLYPCHIFILENSYVGEGNKDGDREGMGSLSSRAFPHSSSIPFGHPNPKKTLRQAQILTRECWREGDADPSGIGVVTAWCQAWQPKCMGVGEKWNHQWWSPDCGFPFWVPVFDQPHLGFSR